MIQAATINAATLTFALASSLFRFDHQRLSVHLVRPRTYPSHNMLSPRLSILNVENIKLLPYRSQLYQLEPNSLEVLTSCLYVNFLSDVHLLYLDPTIRCRVTLRSTVYHFILAFRFLFELEISSCDLTHKIRTLITP